MTVLLVQRSLAPRGGGNVSAVAGDQRLRDQLLERLGRHGQRFSSDRFVTEFRAIVDG